MYGGLLYFGDIRGSTIQTQSHDNGVMIATAEHGLVVGFVISIVVAFIGIDVVRHHARDLRIERIVAQCVIQITC